MLAVLEDLFWALRRRGVRFSPAQAIDAARAAGLVGVEDRVAFRDALAAVLVTRASERVRFEAAFDDFFASDGPHARDLEGRLRARGLDAAEAARVVALLEAMGVEGGDASAEGARLLLMLTRGARFEHALTSSEVERALRGLASAGQVGYFAQRVLGVLGAAGAQRALGKLRMALEGELGPEAGARALEIVAREIELAKGEVRRHVEAQVPQVDDEGSGRGRAFAALEAEQVAEVRRAVRVLGERLRGAARVKQRRAARGRVDGRRTMALAMRTQGVALELARRERRRERPRLWVLCDVSDSVRVASVFLLEFVAVTQELFDRTRTFVFVSDLGETTRLFDGRPIEQALAEVFGGGVVSLTSNSSYGRVLRQFEERHGREIDRRSTVVVLGDGRTNHQPPEVEVLARLRDRARAVYWLCPEPRGSWGMGDSVMLRYEQAVTRVLMASTAAELEAAARALVAAR